MDHNTIYQLFAATHQADANLQNDAEITIHNYEHQAGFLPIVLQLSATSDIDLKTRLAAAIYFKNSVHKRWDAHNDTMSISLTDKVTIQQSILHALYASPSLIQAPLTSSLYAILKVDFLLEWPTFIHELREFMISHEDLGMVQVGLIALREVVKVYQYKSIERRKPLNHIIDYTFPAMLMVCQNLMQLDTTQAANLLSLSLKIYHASMKVELPSSLKDFSSSLSPWITLFLQIVNQELPYNLTFSETNSSQQAITQQYQDVEKLEVRWALKKWAYLCLNQLFSKYGNPSLQPPDCAFAAAFVEHIAPDIVQSYLQQLNVWISQGSQQAQQQQYNLTKAAESQKACLSLTAAFFDDAIKHKVTWQLLKPHTDVLISQFIFQQLCFSPEEEKLWSDPIEYIHRELDVKTQDNTINLLVDLANCRRKHTFMNILNFIQNVMNEQNAIPEDQQRDGYLKDGALRMFGSLVPVILSGDETDIVDQIEAFFTTHVFPEFQSKFPYLRARACQLLYQFDSFNFINESNLAIMYQHVLTCLKDNELPVKVHTALALNTLARYDCVQQAMNGPQLPHIIQEILALSREVDIEQLPSVLQDLVETFAAQLAPFAVELCTQLRDMYLRKIEELIHQQQHRQIQQNDKDGHFFPSSVTVDSADDEEELADGENQNNNVSVVHNTRVTTAAAGLLKTMCALVLSFNQITEAFSPELLMQLEGVIAPAISNTLNCSSSIDSSGDAAIVATALVDLYGDLLDLVDACTFSMKSITPTMWSLLADCIYPAFKNQLFHMNMIDLYSALQNYLMYGKDVVTINEQVRNMLLDIIAITLRTDNVGDDAATTSLGVDESERTCACKLMQTILLNYRGDMAMDVCVDPFLKLVFPYITSNRMKTLEFKIHCLEVVISSLYYNPPLTLQFLEEHQLSQGFLNLWFTVLEKFSRVHDKKLVILTICSLLTLPNENIPVSLQPAWPHLLTRLTEVFRSLPEAIENRDQLLKEGEEDGEDGEDNDEEDDDAGDEAVVENVEEPVIENGDEDGDVVEDEDAEYLEFLTQQAHSNGNKQAVFTYGKTKGQQQDEPLLEDEELQEDTTYQSPLEDIDPYICFAQTFEKLQQQNPDLYTHITKVLDEEQQNIIMSIINTAQEQQQNE